MMNERKRLLYLILVMLNVALIVGGIAMYALYNAAINAERDRLLSTVQSQAHLISSIARFTAAHGQGYPGGPEAAILTQIRDAHRNYRQFGETGEFTLARRRGNEIVWLVSHRLSELEQPPPTPIDSGLAQPMVLALSGKWGTIIGRDYRGAEVVAAFQPLPELGIGIVTKIDLAEVRKPFIRAALTNLPAALLVVLLGSVVFLSISNPMIRRLEELYETATRELSDRKRAEAKMAELQQLAQRRERLADIGAITAEIVHDLGSPLSGLSMQAQLLRRRMARGDYDREKIGQSADRIVNITNRLDALIRDFTGFARDQTLELEEFSLDEFLTEIIELWEQQGAQQGIEITLGKIERPLRIKADKGKLHRILDNLIKNAIEAIGDSGGKVLIGLAKVEDGRVEISVEDNGPGVAADIDVFGLFKTTKAEGTGVGLAIVKQLAEAHGGFVSYEPASPHGTIFRVELPVEGPISPIVPGKGAGSA